MEETQSTQRYDLARAAAEPPLFVDLDGSLLKVDLLPEAMLSAACRQRVGSRCDFCERWPV